MKNRLNAYPLVTEFEGRTEFVKENSDFKVRVRIHGGEWQELPVFNVNVAARNQSQASMVRFDFMGSVEVEVSPENAIETVKISPLSYGIEHKIKDNKIYFTLDKPKKLSVEINGDNYHNLHVLTEEIDENEPDINDPEVLYLKSSMHRTSGFFEKAAGYRTIYFAPGIHLIDEVILNVPSKTEIYLAGGAILVGSFVMNNVNNVTIRGRGIVYLQSFDRFTGFRGFRIRFSTNITIEGITVVNPPHYTVYIGQSNNIKIKNFNTFSNHI